MQTQDYLSAILNEEALLITGLEEAYIGICHTSTKHPVAAYDYRACLRILQDYGLSRQEAEDQFETCILGAWRGDNSPVFIER